MISRERENLLDESHDEQRIALALGVPADIFETRADGPASNFDLIYKLFFPLERNATPRELRLENRMSIEGHRATDDTGIRLQVRAGAKLASGSGTRMASRSS